MQPGESDLACQLRDLRRRLEKLERSPRLSAATIGEGGLTITDGGTLTLTDAVDGHAIAIIGALPADYNRADGSPQQGLLLNREDGSHALVLADPTPTTPPFKQYLNLADRSGNVVFADDPNGVGIALPLFAAGAMVNSDTSTWPATSASSWTQIALSATLRQNPGIYFAIYVVADPGTTGKVRMLVDGTVVATSSTATSTFALWSGQYLWPAGWSFLSYAQITFEAEVLSGSGSVRASALLLTGAH